MKYVALSLLILIALFFVDIKIAGNADDFLRRTNANLNERLSEVSLDGDGPYKQGCLIEKIYFLYVYQTCFMRGLKTANNKDATFSFVYHKPMPLLYFYGRSKDSYYFKESVLGERLAEVKSGVISQERLRSLKN